MLAGDTKEYMLYVKSEEWALVGFYTFPDQIKEAMNEIISRSSRMVAFKIVKVKTVCFTD